MKFLYSVRLINSSKKSQKKTKQYANFNPAHYVKPVLHTLIFYAQVYTVKFSTHLLLPHLHQILVRIWRRKKRKTCSVRGITLHLVNVERWFKCYPPIHRDINVRKVDILHFIMTRWLPQQKYIHFSSSWGHNSVSKWIHLKMYVNDAIKNCYCLLFQVNNEISDGDIGLRAIGCCS